MSPAAVVSSELTSFGCRIKTCSMGVVSPSESESLSTVLVD